MGFFSKIFKGVKNVVNKIGKGIKGVFKGVGKFMNKIGIVGQIALMFLPVGPLIAGMMKGLGGMASTVLGSLGTVGNAVLNGAKFVIEKAGAFAGGVKNTFQTVTQGVKTFVSEFTKTGLNKMGFDPTKFGFKAGGSFDAWVKSGKGQTFGDAWGKVTTNITENASKILDPFKKSVVADSKTSLESLSDSTYKSVDELREMNPNIRTWDDISGKTINLDPDNIADVKGFATLKPGESIMSPRLADPTSPDFDLDSGYGDPSTLSVRDAVTSATTDASGKSLLGMPSVGSAVTQVGVGVASDALQAAIAGPPPEPYFGGEVVDAGYAQVYGATQPQNFIQAAADPYSGYRDPSGLFGYGTGNNNIYAQYMQQSQMYGKV